MKWNSTYLLVNDTTNDYTVSGTHIVDDQPVTVTLVTDQQFRDIMIAKYNIFNMLSPGYPDPETHQYVSLVTNKTEAIAYFKKLFDRWVADKIAGYIKLYEALRATYNPVNNYDKTIHSTMEYSGTETTTETPTGKETVELTKTGSEKSTETPTGEESVEHSIGQSTVTSSKTTYDSATFQDTDKQVDNARTNTDTTKFEDRQTETELSFTNRKDTEERSFTGRKTETEKAFDDRVDTYNYREWGNIGVTTSQQMITSQFPLTELDKLQHYIVNDFVHNNLII